MPTTGSNQTQNKVSMTSPAIYLPQDRDDGAGGFRCQIDVVCNGPRVKLGDIPDPQDGRAQITTLSSREVAVIRFKGYARQDEVKSAEERLLEELKKAAIETVGSPFLMQYNPPWTPGFLRRNEVAVEIRK
jgi:hypothetical protein